MEVRVKYENKEMIFTCTFSNIWNSDIWRNREYQSRVKNGIFANFDEKHNQTPNGIKDMFDHEFTHLLLINLLRGTNLFSKEIIGELQERMVASLSLACFNDTNEISSSNLKEQKQLSLEVMVFYQIFKKIVTQEMKDHFYNLRENLWLQLESDIRRGNNLVFEIPDFPKLSIPPNLELESSLHPTYLAIIDLIQVPNYKPYLDEIIDYYNLNCVKFFKHVKKKW